MEYQIGLVIGAAGMSDAQLADVKARLKFIAAQTLGKDGVIVTVPALPKAKPGSARDVEVLCAPLKKLEYVALDVIADALNVDEFAELFWSHDEVWCLPATRQTIMTKARAWLAYEQVGKWPEQKRKYKLIPPWSRDDETKTKQRKA